MHPLWKQWPHASDSVASCREVIANCPVCHVMLVVKWWRSIASHAVDCQPQVGAEV